MMYRGQYLSLKELILKMMIEMDLSIVDFSVIEKDNNRLDIVPLLLPYMSWLLN